MSKAYDPASDTLVYIEAVKVGKKILVQYIEHGNDSVYFLDEADETRTPVFTIDSWGSMFNADGDLIGQFSMFGADNWAYRPEGIGDPVYNLGWDLIRAERMIVERILSLEK